MFPPFFSIKRNRITRLRRTYISSCCYLRKNNTSKIQTVNAKVSSFTIFQKRVGPGYFIRVPKVTIYSFRAKGSTLIRDFLLSFLILWDKCHSSILLCLKKMDI